MMKLKTNKTFIKKKHKKKKLKIKRIISEFEMPTIKNKKMSF